MDWEDSDDLVGDAPASEDQYEADAVERLVAAFDQNRRRIFYGRQLEVWFEKDIFHWVTNRALKGLAAAGEVHLERVKMPGGSPIVLSWHKSYRYPKRDVSATLELVGRYSHPTVGAALGDRGEALVLDGFASNQFVQLGRETRSHNGLTWHKTEHDFDFVFARDGREYAVEVKNTLGYPSKEEIETKIAIADHLGLIPVFVCRQLPKSWISEINTAGGFALILGYQLYPPYLRPLVDELIGRFDLPVDTPRRLQDGTMKRFVRWHDGKVQRTPPL